MKKVILLMMFFLFVILLSSCEKPKEVPIPTKVTFRYDYETLYETYTYDKNIDFSTLYVGSAPKKSTFVSGDVWYECVFSGWSSIKEGDGDVVCYPRFNQIKKDNPIYGVYNKSGLIKFMKTCSISEMYINEKYYPQYRYFVKEHYYIGYIEELDLFCLTFSESNKYLIAYYFKYKQFNDTYKAFADIGFGYEEFDASVSEHELSSFTGSETIKKYLKNLIELANEFCINNGFGCITD